MGSEVAVGKESVSQSRDNILRMARVLSEEHSVKILFAIQNVPRSIPEICRITGIPQATCYRTIRTMESLGLVRRTRTLLTRDGHPAGIYVAELRSAQLHIDSGRLRLRLVYRNDVDPGNKPFDEAMYDFTHEETRDLARRMESVGSLRRPLPASVGTGKAPVVRASPRWMENDIEVTVGAEVRHAKPMGWDRKGVMATLQRAFTLSYEMLDRSGEPVAEVRYDDVRDEIVITKAETSVRTRSRFFRPALLSIDGAQYEVHEKWTGALYFALGEDVIAEGRHTEGGLEFVQHEDRLAGLMPELAAGYCIRKLCWRAVWPFPL